MTLFQGVMRFVSAAISIYTLIIMLRILLSWFNGPSMGRATEILHTITEPYLGWFRKFEFLKFGRIDFSPIVAIIVLSVAGSVAGRLAVEQTVTLGLILAIFIQLIGSSAGFFVGLFMVLAIIRAIGSMTSVDTGGRFWMTLDQLLEPAVHRVISYFAKGRFVSYRNGLLFFAGGMAAVLFLGRYVIAFLISLALRIPF